MKPHGNIITSLVFSSNCNFIISGDLNNKILVYNLEKRTSVIFFYFKLLLIIFYKINFVINYFFIIFLILKFYHYFYF